jgi:hypothetical protein
VEQIRHEARSLATGPLTPADLGLDDAVAEFERREAARRFIRRPPWARLVVVALAVLLLAGLSAYDFVLHDGFHGALLDTATPNGVHDACNRFVAKRLDPRTDAAFAPFDAAAITLEGRDGTDIAYVDTTARSGVRTRVPFTCEVRYDGHGRWALTHLDVTPS